MGEFIENGMETKCRSVKEDIFALLFGIRVFFFKLSQCKNKKKLREVTFTFVFVAMQNSFFFLVI